MGYEIKLMIGEPCLRQEEYKYCDTIKRYDDGSCGRELKRDENNNLIPTGRTEYYFSIWATVDLCKPGYTDHIARIPHVMPPERKEVVYWYSHGGNVRETEDRYGAELRPVPLREVLTALKKDDQEYRRYRWAVALLESMVDEKGAAVLLYGY